MRAQCIVVAVLTTSVPALADDDPCAPDLVDPSPLPPAPTSMPSPDTVTVRGKLRQKSDGQGLAGGTIVAELVGRTDGMQTAISDEHGDYTLEVVPGRYTITVYYVDSTIRIATNLLISTRLDMGHSMIDDTVFSPHGCDFGPPGPELTAQPFFGLTLARKNAPVSRERTHVPSVELLASADARTAVTTLERGVRLHGAPGIPSIFVDETSVHTLRTPILQASSSGGSVDVGLRSGNNETRADARLVLGLDRTSERTDRVVGQEAFVGAPISKDNAWIAIGLAADADRRVNGLMRLDFAVEPEHQGGVMALAQDTGVARDGWAQGRWTSKFMDYRLQFRALVTAERLELAPDAVAHASVPGAIAPLDDVVQRVGGVFDVTYRFKALGSHILELLAASGTGTIGIERHGDVSLAVGDSWQIRPNIQLDVGARSDTRTVGEDRAMVVSPRMSLAYDYTKEGRSDVFVAVQRVPHLDDGFVGAWRGDTMLVTPGRFHDEVATGISHLWGYWPYLMVGIAGRAVQRQDADDVDKGIDAWLRYEKRATYVHVSGSTLRKTAAIHAQRRMLDTARHQIGLATTARTTELDDGVSTPTRSSEVGGAFAWTLQPREKKTGGKVTTTLELYDGTFGPGARVILGGTW